MEEHIILARQALANGQPYLAMDCIILALEQVKPQQPIPVEILKLIESWGKSL
jgi:hypothetical protein